MKPSLCAALLLLPLAARAEPADELRDAVTALARTSYRWETTTRQRFNGESTELRPTLNAPIAVEGKVDANGFTQITLPPSRELAASVTVLFRDGDAVALTPLGWLRRTQMRAAPGPDRDVEFEGKHVRLSRALAVGLKAAAERPLTEDLFDLTFDLKSCRREQGLIIAELRDHPVEKLWGDDRATHAPEIQGTIIFKLGDEGLTEYHVVLAIGFPNDRTRKTAWTMQQWTTRISGIGATTIEPPAEALAALDK